jgi:hypothetical protein
VNSQPSTRIYYSDAKGFDIRGVKLYSNDYTRYQALPGNAYPEALPPQSPPRQSLWTSVPRQSLGTSEQSTRIYYSDANGFDIRGVKLYITKLAPLPVF